MSNGQQQAGGNAAASIYNFFSDSDNRAWVGRNLKEAGNFIGRNAESVGGFFQSQFNSVSGWFKSPNVPDYSALNESFKVNNISTFGGGKIGTYQGSSVGGGGIGTSILDNFQTTLDVAGIADPTGIVDGVNALIYAGRGQWGNAGISAMGIIPYVGDAGKALRLQSKLMSKGGKGLWTLTSKGASSIKNHKTFGTIYKSNSDGLWRAVDKAGHGGSKFKVFKESNKGLEWYKDADEFGDFIINKHKGSTGTFIPWGQLGTGK